MPKLLRAQPGAVVAALLVLHAAIWTVIPSVVNPNLPLDVIEGLAWGHAWQWGYEKHPPLSPWLAELAYMLAPGQGWTIYLLSALCVTLAFWAVWRLALDFVSPSAAVFAVLLLEGIYYHNFTSPEFNANVVLLPCWALSVLCLWRALTKGSLWAWGLFGLFGALGLLGKYFTAFLIVPLGLFLLIDRKSRAAWRTPGPYVAMVVALAVLGPHLAWMLANDFQPIAYALRRSSALSDSALVRHIAYPGKFLLAQLVALLPMVGLLLALGRPQVHHAVPTRDRRFLIAAGVAPLILVILVSAAFGLRLRSMWGTPLFLFAGLIAVVWFMPARLHLRRFGATWASLFVFAPALYATLALVQPYITGAGKRVHFPGRDLAWEVGGAWTARFPDALPTVIGSEWLAGNVGAYLPTRPQVYIHGDDAARSRWLDDLRVRTLGAAVVWEVAPDAGSDADRDPPAGLVERFICLEPQPPIELSWQTGAALPPLHIGLALIAPAVTCAKP